MPSAYFAIYFTISSFSEPFISQSQVLKTLKEKLKKTLLEKDKMLVSSISSFPPVFFAHLDVILRAEINLLSTLAFRLVYSKVLLYSKGLVLC